MSEFNEVLEAERVATSEAEAKASLMEAKLKALEKGVNKANLDDVVELAKTKVTEETTLDQAIDSVIEAYPGIKVNSNAEPIPRVITQKSKLVKPPKDYDPKAFSKMSYKEKLELYNNDKEKYDLLERRSR